MNEHAVLTAVGQDRTGLVDAVSQYILECGCNLEDSRMAILGGEFAMLILVAGEPEHIERLIAGVGAAGARCELSLHARRTRLRPPAGRGAAPYELQAFSLDHPGIVQRLSHFLAERQVNIRALDTHVTHAPVTGLPLFAIRAALDIPVEVNVPELRRGLEALGAQENIDVDLRPVPPR